MQEYRLHKKRKSPKPGRVNLGKNLQIGEEATEILDYIPAELYVKQFIRHKYVASLSGGFSSVITASLPGHLMEKCMAGEGLLAQMIVSNHSFPKKIEMGNKKLCW